MACGVARADVIEGRYYFMPTTKTRVHNNHFEDEQLLFNTFRKTEDVQLCWLVPALQ